MTCLASQRNNKAGFEDIEKFNNKDLE